MIAFQIYIPDLQKSEEYQFCISHLFQTLAPSPLQWATNSWHLGLLATLQRMIKSPKSTTWSYVSLWQSWLPFWILHPYEYLTCSRNIHVRSRPTNSHRGGRRQRRSLKIHTYIYIYIYIHMYKYIYICVCIYIYICTRYLFPYVAVSIQPKLPHR